MLRRLGGIWRVLSSSAHHHTPEGDEFPRMNRDRVTRSARRQGVRKSFVRRTWGRGLYADSSEQSTDASSE